MIDNKVKVIVIIVVLIITTVIIKSLNNKSDSNNSQSANSIKIEIKQDEETGEYYVTGDNGQIVQSSHNIDDLYIYEIDSDYDPKVSFDNEY